jgi:GlpG protein
LRQIGTLPANFDPQVFGDHLLTLGMQARFDQRPEGWLVWIYNEDHVPRARSELEAYLSHPEDPRFDQTSRRADDLRRQQEKLEREYRRNFREVSEQWTGPLLRHCPLTFALVAIAVVVFVLEQSPRGAQVKHALMITTLRHDALRGWQDEGLKPVLSGELWRLITPIFLHFGIWHILFNCWAISVEGTMIELRRGTLRLSVLVLVSALISNLGQYFYMDRANAEGLHLFGGLSGVGYALFGYLWMKGQYEPESGLILHPNTITTMLLWLVLCMTGLLAPVANAAHVVGLFVGIAFGITPF